MSGAIIYAHHKLPLSFILEEARKCEEKAKDEGKDRVCLKYIKRSLSSAEFMLNWNKFKDFKNLKQSAIDIPNTFIYQLNQLLSEFDNDLKISKKITKYLLQRKLTNTKDKKTKIETIIHNELVSKNFTKLPEILKIIKFLEA